MQDHFTGVSTKMSPSLKDHIFRTQETQNYMLESAFKIAELWSSISLCPSFPNIYLLLDIYILTKFPKYDMKDRPLN